jgi:hypothetical protein
MSKGKAALAWRTMSADERDPFVQEVMAHNTKLDEAKCAAKLEAAHGPDEAKCTAELEAAHEPETECELEKLTEEEWEKKSEEEWQKILSALAEEKGAAAAEEQAAAAEEQALAEQVDEIESAKKRQKILDGGASHGTASLPASPGNESRPGSLSSFSPYSDGDADDGSQTSEAECLQPAAEVDRNQSLHWLVLPLLRIQQELQSPTSASSSSSSATWVFGQAARQKPLGAEPGDL